MSDAALGFFSVNAKNGIESHEAVMLFCPMNGFVDKIYEMRGEFFKCLLDSVQFTTEDESDKFRFDYFVAVCHALSLLVNY